LPSCARQGRIKTFESDILSLFPSAFRREYSASVSRAFIRLLYFTPRGNGGLPSFFFLFIFAILFYGTQKVKTFFQSFSTLPIAAYLEARRQPSG
jgi:hypothetical protein